MARRKRWENVAQFVISESRCGTSTSKVTGAEAGADRNAGDGVVMTVGDGGDAGADGKADGAEDNADNADEDDALPLE